MRIFCSLILLNLALTTGVWAGLDFEIFGISRKAVPGFGVGYTPPKDGDGLRPRGEGGYFSKDNQLLYYVGFGSQHRHTVTTNYMVNTDFTMQIAYGSGVAFYPVINTGIAMRLGPGFLSYCINLYPSVFLPQSERSEGPLIFLTYLFDEVDNTKLKRE